MQSSRDAAAANDRSNSPAAADDLLDMNRGLGQVDGDLVQTYPDVQNVSAPHRRVRKRSESGTFPRRTSLLARPFLSN